MINTIGKARGVRLLLIAMLALSIGARRAHDERATVSAQINYTALQPGQQAVIAVVLDVANGFHAQSHVPKGEGSIATTITLDANNAIKFNEPLYPPGRDVTYPALGQLNVYTGRQIFYVPVEVPSDAHPGPVKLTGSIEYQICDDKVCYAPETSAFEISTQVVPAGQTLSSNHPELFTGFDPRTFVRAVAPAESSTLFGFELRPDAYVLAFLGAFVVGMLFNVMPCVLPIVPLKIMGFYHASQEHRGKSLALGAVFSAGLISTFGALALLVVVFRTLAWGQLFGNAWFSGAIVIVLLVLALQTFGVFEVVLPSGIYNVAPKQETYLGNFLFGILTAILSTPCTFGMFLGLLVWASTQRPTIGVALVMIVGAGMAFPYFLLSAFPQVAKNFPRTGPWAQIVKQMMGFLLIGTAVYFARRFLPEALRETSFWWLLFAVIGAAGLFLIARTLHFTRRPLPVAIACIVALLLVAPALAVTLRLTYVPVKWIRYSPQEFADARASGNPVLIDFTAAWCGNCQAIEATVYVDDRAVEALKKYHVTTIKADLTDTKAPGWELLRTLHPVGAIPFTAVYLPGENDPHKLAGIYTTGDLIQTIAPAAIPAAIPATLSTAK